MVNKVCHNSYAILLAGLTWANIQFFWPFYIFWHEIVMFFCLFVTKTNKKPTKTLITIVHFHRRSFIYFWKKGIFSFILTHWRIIFLLLSFLQNFLSPVRHSKSIFFRRQIFWLKILCRGICLKYHKTCTDIRIFVKLRKLIFLNAHFPILRSKVQFKY